MNLNKAYENKIKKNRCEYNGLIRLIKRTKDIDDKLYYAQLALIHATYKNSGVYTSSYLEHFYTEYAKTIDIDDYNISYEPNSFLHVLTSGYNTGGHTRVVERWIYTAPLQQKHSVVFINQNEPIETIDKYVIQKSGESIYFSKDLSLKEKALNLRKLGLHYQYIILHTHMEDPTATVAFGTEKFTRPVLLYNHASHRFWLGKAIADVVLDILKNDPLTRKYRKIDNVKYLGIPLPEKTYPKYNKTEVRKELNLDPHLKIIVSAGAAYKYKTSAPKESLLDILLPVLEDKKILLIIIGYIDNLINNPIIKKDNIVLLPSIDFNQEYLKYICAADLFIDSYPISGWTTIIDAISENIPALSYKNLHLDFFEQSNAIYYNEYDYRTNIKKLLYDDNFAKLLTQKQYYLLYKELSNLSWNNRLSNILNTLDNKHQVKDLSSEKDIYAEYTPDLANYLEYNTLLDPEKSSNINKYFYLLKFIIHKYITKNRTKYRNNVRKYFNVP